MHPQDEVKRLMRLRTFQCAAVLAASSLLSWSQTSVSFRLSPVQLTNGWTVTGSVTTDGSVGTLSAANIVDWNLTVVQTADTVWTEKDSYNLNISGVSSDGKRLLVATSPDGVLDGGNLSFSRAGGGGTIPTSAIIADFTQLSVNLGYVGGLAGWQDEIAGLNFVGLNQANNTKYRAAFLSAKQPNMFRISVPHFRQPAGHDYVRHHQNRRYCRPAAS
jgi:hypothetical protein